MKLILTTEVPDLGGKGDVVEVSAGYARNYLLPGKKAVPATQGAMRTAERARAARDQAVREARETAEQIASSLEGVRVVIAAHAGDEGRLYGSVGPADVVEGIRRFTGIELDRKQIEMRSPIREIGLHTVAVRVHPEVEFSVALDVVPV